MLVVYEVSQYLTYISTNFLCVAYRITAFVISFLCIIFLCLWLVMFDLKVSSPFVPFSK